MISQDILKKIADEGLDYIRSQKDISDAEIFISSLSHLLSRIHYTSFIPCNGVEEPKSTLSYGIGVQVVFKGGSRRSVGFGGVTGNISHEGIREAIDKARLSAVEDPDFHELPHPPDAPADVPVLKGGYHDPELMNISDEKLVELGWRALSGAVSTIDDPEMAETVIVGGDISIIQEKMALASTTGIAVEDEAAYASASITTMIENDNAKGSGWEIGMQLRDFMPENAGRTAAESAIHSRSGQRISTGQYRIILGPQPVADLLSHIVLPSLTLSVADAASSTFLKKFGQAVADSRLSIYDHGGMKGLPMSRRYTCEGLATGRTDLIKNGVLKGFLSNHYYRNKVLNDPSSAEKLGAEPSSMVDALTPRNGFRPGESMIRNFMGRPSILPTNVMVEGSGTMTSSDLIRTIGEGIYIGRIWYTYPINGLLAGDFTCTIVGDSYLIKDGKISSPLKPNSVRISDNIHNLLNQIIAFSEDSRPTLLWGSPEVIYSPDIAVRDIHLYSIGE